MAQQPNRFAKAPFQGFTRRIMTRHGITPYSKLTKNYNYIQRSNWHMIMQFLRKN